MIIVLFRQIGEPLQQIMILFLKITVEIICNLEIISFQDLKRSLQISYMCVIIGYAFNDEFIFEVFQESLANGNKMVIVNPHANELKSKFPQKYEGNIIALPIRFGTEYFGPQIQDFFAGVKTLKIKLKTDVDSSIAFSSSHPIQSNSTLLDDKVTNT